MAIQNQTQIQTNSYTPWKGLVAMALAGVAGYKLAKKKKHRVPAAIAGLALGYFGSQELGLIGKPKPAIRPAEEAEEEDF